jgi:hypothetical protein
VPFPRDVAGAPVDTHKGKVRMRTFKYFMLATLVVVGFGLGVFPAAFEDKPKYTIPEVMKTAHAGKDALVKKAIAGTASKEEKEKLVELYTALSQNKPPKGDAKSWKDKTDALVSSAKGVLADEKGAVDKLKKASTCMACHDVHKADD